MTPVVVITKTELEALLTPQEREALLSMSGPCQCPRCVARRAKANEEAGAPGPRTAETATTAAKPAPASENGPPPEPRKPSVLERFKYAAESRQRRQDSLLELERDIARSQDVTAFLDKWVGKGVYIDGV